MLVIKKIVYCKFLEIKLRVFHYLSLRPICSMFTNVLKLKKHDSNCLDFKAINTTCKCTTLKSENSGKYLRVVIDSFLINGNTHIDLFIKKFRCMYTKFKIGT